MRVARLLASVAFGLAPWSCYEVSEDATEKNGSEDTDADTHTDVDPDADAYTDMDTSTPGVSTVFIYESFDDWDGGDDIFYMAKPYYYDGPPYAYQDNNTRETKSGSVWTISSSEISRWMIQGALSASLTPVF